MTSWAERGRWEGIDGPPPIALAHEVTRVGATAAITSAVTLTYTSTAFAGDFVSEASGQFMVDSDAPKGQRWRIEVGWLMAQQSASGTGHSLDVWVEVDAGGGFIEADGTRRSAYTASSSPDAFDGSHCTATLLLDPGDKVRVRAARTRGSGTVVISSARVSLAMGAVMQGTSRKLWSGTDDRLVRWNGADAIQDSTWTLTDAGAMSATVAPPGPALDLSVSGTTAAEVYRATFSGDSTPDADQWYLACYDSTGLVGGLRGSGSSSGVVLASASGGAALHLDAGGIADVQGTGALQVPDGTTGQRPSAAAGQIRWNTTTSLLEVRDASAWRNPQWTSEKDQASGYAGLDANARVNFGRIQNVAADSLLGSVSGGSPQEIACTAAGRALLDDASVEAQRVTLGVLQAQMSYVNGDKTLSGASLGFRDVEIAVGAGENWMFMMSFETTVSTIDDMKFQLQTTGTAIVGFGPTNNPLQARYTQSDVIVVNQSGSPQQHTVVGHAIGQGSGGTVRLYMAKNGTSAGSGTLHGGGSMIAWRVS